MAGRLSSWVGVLRRGRGGSGDLAKWLESDDPGQRRAAVLEIGRGERPDLVDRLLRRVTDSDAGVRHSAIGALCDTGQTDQEEAVRAFREATADHNLEVRLIAVAALGECSEAGWEPLQQSMLRDISPAVRLTAADSLDRAGWEAGKDRAAATYWALRHEWDKCAELGEVAVPPLRSALHEVEPEQRIEVIQALAGIGEPSLDVLGEALADGSPQVRVAAVAAMADLGGSQAAELLFPLIADADPEVGQSVAEALTKVGEVALPYLVAELADTDPKARLAAVRIIGTMVGEAAAEQLVITLSDVDPEVRQAAESALTAMGDVAHRPLRRVLRDPIDHVRQFAEATLGQPVS